MDNKTSLRWGFILEKNKIDKNLKYVYYINSIHYSLGKFMTMHLEGPWLSTTGKRKGKVKWRSAEQKRQSLQLEKDWQMLKQKLGVEDQDKKRIQGLKAKPLLYKLSAPPGRTTNSHIPSHDSGIGSAAKKAAPIYTGYNIVGIGTLHKSNAVPIFSDKEAKEISSMRR